MSPRLNLTAGLALLVIGLLCHVVAAQAIGGTFLAYRDHLAGFAILTIVTGAILAGLGAKFWKGRRDITVLALGAVQTAIGIWVYIERFSVHG
jgi:hypothetical protein